jgi:hypothetical protein
MGGFVSCTARYIPPPPAEQKKPIAAAARLLDGCSQRRITKDCFFFFLFLLGGGLFFCLCRSQRVTCFFVSVFRFYFLSLGETQHPSCQLTRLLLSYPPFLLSFPCSLDAVQFFFFSGAGPDVTSHTNPNLTKVKIKV